MIDLSRIQEELSQVINLKKSILISIGICNDAKNSQKSEINKTLSNDRPHV